MNQQTGVLDLLAIKHATDKSSLHHDYCKYYEKYLEPLRDFPITLLEIGVGGDEDENFGGNSLRMWHDYFKYGKIIGVDISHKKGISNSRTKFYQLDQTNKEGLNVLVKKEGMPDVIIDDASHINELTIKTFGILFPLLKKGGLYIIEDLHSSYTYPYYRDANPNPSEGETAMNFIKRLTDEVNKDFFKDEYKLGYEIEFIHFYKDMAIIKKKI